MIHYNSIIISIYILWIARIGGDTGSGSCWVSSTGFGCWMLALAVHDWHVKTRDQSLKPVQSLDPALDGVHLFKPCRIKNIGGRYGRLFLEREVSPIWWSSSWGINHDKPIRVGIYPLALGVSVHLCSEWMVRLLAAKLEIHQQWRGASTRQWRGHVQTMGSEPMILPCGGDEHPVIPTMMWTKL